MIFSVIRDGTEYVVESDRDVEELGGSVGEEILYIKNTTPNTRVNLSKFVLTQSDINVTHKGIRESAENEVTIYPNQRESCGSKCLWALKTHGYFRLSLQPDERQAISKKHLPPD